MGSRERNADERFEELDTSIDDSMNPQSPDKELPSPLRTSYFFWQNSGKSEVKKEIGPGMRKKEGAYTANQNLKV